MFNTRLTTFQKGTLWDLISIKAKRDLTIGKRGKKCGAASSWPEVWEMQVTDWPSRGEGRYLALKKFPQCDDATMRHGLHPLNTLHELSNDRARSRVKSLTFEGRDRLSCNIRPE